MYSFPTYISGIRKHRTWSFCDGAIRARSKTTGQTNRPKAGPPTRRTAEPAAKPWQTPMRAGFPSRLRKRLGPPPPSWAMASVVCRPLVYFHGVVPGQYLSVRPVHVVGHRPSELTAVVDVDAGEVGVQTSSAAAEVRRGYSAQPYCRGRRCGDDP